jgi:hypothetical protein
MSWFNPLKKGKVKAAYQSGLDLNPNIFDKVAGLYVISLTASSKRSTRPLAFKVGKATNLWNRLAGYHTCYMDGYTLHNVVLLVNYNGDFSKLRPESRQGSIQKRITYIERETHNILKQYKVGTASRASEWFEMEDGKVDRITRAIQKAYRESPKKLFEYQMHPNRTVAPTLITQLDMKKYDKVRRDLKLLKFRMRK